MCGQARGTATSSCSWSGGAAYFAIPPKNFFYQVFYGPSQESARPPVPVCDEMYVSHATPGPLGPSWLGWLTSPSRVQPVCDPWNPWNVSRPLSHDYFFVVCCPGCHIFVTRRPIKPRCEEGDSRCEHLPSHTLSGHTLDAQKSYRCHNTMLILAIIRGKSPNVAKSRAHKLACTLHAN